MMGAKNLYFKPDVSDWILNHQNFKKYENQNQILKKN